MLNVRSTLIASLLVLAACTSEVTSEPEEIGVTGGALGFERWLAEQPQHPDAPHLYIIEGDLPMTREEALDHYHEHVEQSQLAFLSLRATGAYILWPPAQRMNLTYCISNAFDGTLTPKAKIASLMNEAAAQWEAAAPIDFRYVPAQDANCTNTNNNVLFNVVPRDHRLGGQNLGFLPDAPRDRRQLIFRTDVGTGSPDTQRYFVTHELGHILGFHHEQYVDPIASGCANEIDTQLFNIVQPTRYDAASVMHYTGGCRGSNFSGWLSAYDKRGARCAYTGYCEWAAMGAARDVAVGPQGQVWSISNTAANTASGNGHRLQRWNHQTLTWDLQPTTFGAGARIAVDSAGLPWWVDSAGKIFRRLSNNTTQLLPGFATDIGAGAGMVWVTGGLQSGDGYLVYRFEPAINNWTWIPGAVGKRIAVDSTGRTWIVGNSGAVHSYAGNTWTLDVTWGMRDVGAGGNGSVWTVGGFLDSFGNGPIYEYTPQDPLVKFMRVTGSAREVGVAHNGQPWVVNSFNTAYINVWEPVP